MIPVVALVGRTNVGKSTLFNRLTKSNDAIVADYPGLTRDRKYGSVEWEKNKFILIDTIGIDGIKNDLNMITENQSIIAIEEADIVIFMVDSRVGLIAADKNIAKYLRKKKKKNYYSC